MQISKLLRGRIDLVPLSTDTAFYTAEKEGYRNKISYLPKPIKSEPYYNTIVKKSHYPNLMGLIQKYDEIIKQMKKNGTLQSIEDKFGK
ncbi:MAG: ABC transporter substrate-binding protein [Oligoflexia bacterium]|nr:ABC transporter substrate-binding protein [Oligoflexia bacterium]